jgi:hypothetical protein
MSVIQRDILNFDSIINTIKIPSHMCRRDEPECFYIRFEYFLIKNIWKWYFLYNILYGHGKTIKKYLKNTEII